MKPRESSVLFAVTLVAVFALSFGAGVALAGEAEPAPPSPDKEGGSPKVREVPEKPAKGEEDPAGKAEDPTGEKPPKSAGEKPAKGEEKPPKAAGKVGKAEKPPKAADAGPTVEEVRELTALTARELRDLAVSQLVLRAPQGGGRNSFFHSMLFIPPIRGAYTLPAESGLVSMSFELSGNDGAREGGNRFETTHFEGLLNLSYALTELVEFHGSVCTALLSGDVDLTWRGQPMVPADREERLRVSSLIMGTKFNLLPLGRGAPDIWVALDFKIQGTDKELADSGRPGLAFSFLVSQALGPIWGHLNFGWALSDGQKSFSPVVESGTGRSEYVPVDRIFFWGISFVWPITKSFAVTLQGLGHTNGFKDLSILNSDVHVVTCGVRGLYKKVFAELVLGGGITETSLDYLVRLEVGMLF